MMIGGLPRFGFQFVVKFEHVFYEYHTERPILNKKSYERFFVYHRGRGAVGVGQTGRRVESSVRTCLSGSRFNRCQVPIVQREPVLLVNPPKVKGARVVRRVTERYKVTLISCAVARRAERDTIKLPFVMGGGCNRRRFSIARCAVDRVVSSICSGVRGANLGRNVLFVSRVGYMSRALTPVVLRFLRKGAFKGRGIPRN